MRISTTSGSARALLDRRRRARGNDDPAVPISPVLWRHATLCDSMKRCNPMSIRQLKAGAGIILVVLVLFALAIPTLAAPAGPPPRPPAGPAADPSLAVHPLTFAPGPLDNPLKGFAP